MKAYGSASERMLYKVLTAGSGKLTMANLEQKEAIAEAGGSATYFLLRNALLELLPLEVEAPDTKQIATLLAFRAIILALDELDRDEIDQEIESASSIEFQAQLFGQLELATPYFLIEAWQEAMNDKGWSYHLKRDFVISDKVDECKDKIWVQKGDRKLKIDKVREVIIKHVCDLIDFHIHKLALHITQRVTMEEWLTCFDRQDTPSNREWMEKRLKVILHH
jgi:hypothetical protein